MLVGLVATSGLVLCAAPPASADLPGPVSEVLPDQVEEPLEPVTDLLPFENDEEEPDPVTPPPVVKLPRNPGTATERPTAAPRPRVAADAPRATAPEAVALPETSTPVVTEIEYAPLPVEYANVAVSLPTERPDGGSGPAMPWVAVAVATTAALGAGTWQVAEIRSRRR